MSRTAMFTIARKELRALFQSPVAILFLSVFLVLTLFLFFTQARFFARNLADVRPLFQWLPVLLIMLVSAVTMRSWAEERKAGTLEVLLTLPVRTADLVMGKFLAGMALVALALAFTLPIPFTVRLLGPLDWGPVIGGYFAALLLAGAYMAIGLCVSSRTDNQVVALMLTLVLGGLLYLVGSEMITSFFTADNAAFLRGFGTGSRFESIERGVFDLRDIAYYGSITAFFLVLNGVFLEWERLDTRAASADGKRRDLGIEVAGLVGAVVVVALARLLAGTTGVGDAAWFASYGWLAAFVAIGAIVAAYVATTAQSRGRAMIGLVGLVGVNVILLNLWLAPVQRARIDLTAGRDYTISPVTKDVLRNLSEPVQIRAFLSENTHPLLAPLVPQIRDLLAEYQIYGGANVRTEIQDPNADEAIEAEINEQYQIESVPFGVADRHSQSVVNAYFHIVVVYGDKFEVLDFQDLIEVRMDSAGVAVKLKNFEYDLTRAIKKVSQDFETMDSLIAKLPAQAQLTAYISPASLPDDYAETANAFRMVGKELAALDPSKVAFTEIDPTGNDQLQQQLVDNFGIQPLAADLFGSQRFYLHLLVTVGTHVERIMPRGDLKEAELRTAIEAAFRRSVPGQLKKVLLATEEPKPVQNPELPPNLQPPPPPADFKYLEQLLHQEYDVERTTLADGFVPEDVDVVVIGKLGKMSPKQEFALDQFLMRGGSVIAMAGTYRANADRTGLKALPEDRSLFDLLEKWGVTVEDGLVMSDKNAPFPQPVQRRIPNGPVLQSIELIPYPFFPDLRGDSLNPNQPALAGITVMTMPWSSPITVPDTLENRAVTWLVKSSPESTVREGGNIDPDVGPDGRPTWPVSGDPKQVTLGVAITGKFPSYFADLPNPLVGGTEADTSGRTLKQSVTEGNLVVLGSSELGSDLMLALAQNTQTEQHSGNLQLVQNLLDWAVEDTDLLSIRTAGAFARTLTPVDDAEAQMIEVRTWLMVLFPVLAVVAIPRIRRRNTHAIPMTAAAEQS